MLRCPHMATAGFGDFRLQRKRVRLNILLVKMTCRFFWRSLAGEPSPECREQGFIITVPEHGEQILCLLLELVEICLPRCKAAKEESAFVLFSPLGAAMLPKGHLGRTLFCLFSLATSKCNQALTHTLSAFR